MMDTTQKANDLRFKILSVLGDGGVELVRDFEQILAEERQARTLNHPYVFTDRRAKAIAEAHNHLNVLAAAIHATDAPEAHLASLKDALVAKEAAYALPEHEYDCILCEQVFQSPARKVLVLNGYVDHDAEGNVIAAKTFHKPAHLVVCPDCKNRLDIESYLTRWDRWAGK